MRRKVMKVLSRNRKDTQHILHKNIGVPALLLLLLTMSLCSALSSQLLKGKRVLITGSGRGIGQAIALICHKEGANVIITSRTESELQETIDLASNQITDEEKNIRLKQSSMAATLLSRRGGKSKTMSTGKSTSVGARRTGSATKARMKPSSISQLADAVKTGSSTTCSSDDESCTNRMLYYLCDVTNESDVDSMIHQILDEEGDIDILINNAGGGQSNKGPVGTLESRDLENIFKLNVLGPQLLTSAICKHSWNKESPNQKVILNISSKAGKVGLQNYSFYVASKFALEGLTSTWSKELLSKNVRVHSISPGMVDTKSFPKPPGKKGVREASSIKDSLLFILTGKIMHEKIIDVVDDMMKYTGHYLHVDEYDTVICEKGIKDAYLAFKQIDEVPFSLE